MKKYYKYKVKIDKVDGLHLLELDEEFYCCRAIFIDEHGSYTTNFIKNDDDRYYLPEGNLEEAISSFQVIPKSVFDMTWSNALKLCSEDWSKHKKEIAKKNQIFKGYIVCFYPQGVIVNIGFKYFGIIDYERCLEVVGKHQMYPGHHFKCEVADFDDENMWFQLKAFTT
ncbi:MAG: hypothetical protein AAGG75_12160 [Bacteroidota bacterium]